MICIFRCPGCGDEIKYDVVNRTMVCSTCGNSVPVEDYDSLSISYEGSFELSSEISRFNCLACGAKAMLKQTDAKAICSYCGSEMAAFGVNEGEINPEFIIPFKYDEVNAKVKLRQWWDEHKGMPKFDQTKLKMTFHQTYVPVWLFDAEVVTTVTAKVAPAEVNIKDIDGDSYIGRMRKTIKSQFVKVPHDGSARIIDERFHGIEPYDYSGLKEFTPAYLSGYPAERYFQDQYDLMPPMISRLQKYGIAQCKEYIESDKYGGLIVGVENQHAVVTPKNVYYVLVPVWVCSYIYKKERKYVYVNGQTGKTDGDMVFRASKMIGETGLYAAASFTLFIGICTLFIGLFTTGKVFLVFLLYVAYILLPIYFSLKAQNEGFSSQTRSVRKNRAKATTKIHINEEVQLKEGKKMHVYSSIGIRFVIGILLWVIVICYNYIPNYYEEWRGFTTGWDGFEHNDVCLIIASTTLIPTRLHLWIQYSFLSDDVIIWNAESL